MAAKEDFVQEYFRRWERDVAKAAELVAQPRYHLEGVLVLSCYLGAFAALRYPALRDGEAYVKIALDYSGKREFFDQIDLLFLYQWPRSKLKDNGNYLAFHNYKEVVEVLVRKFGPQEKFDPANRYLKPSVVLDIVRAAGIKTLDEKNLVEKLPLFSLAELLYRYLRCDAVHSAEFLLITEINDGKGGISYRSNHAITADVLLETAKGVLGNLWKQCMAEKKWPQEL
jgi:hypothetical protein